MTLDDAISRLRALATIADTGTLSVVRSCTLSIRDAEAMREAIRVMERERERKSAQPP